MEVSIHANMSDKSTMKVADALYKPFEELSDILSGEYGGIMEHLWIDIELIESWAKDDGKARYPFRFQKRVSGRSHFGLPPSPDKYNVGHYSVRPDFELITKLTNEDAIHYALSLIYESTSMLLEKKKRLEGFDATLFRKNFLKGCCAIGHKLSIEEL